MPAWAQWAPGWPSGATLSLSHAQMAAVESYSRRQAGVPAEVSAFLKYQPSSVPAELAFESATGILR